MQKCNSFQEGCSQICNIAVSVWIADGARAFYQKWMSYPIAQIKTIVAAHDLSRCCPDRKCAYIKGAGFGMFFFDL